jgi:hypothetical protein
MITPSFALTATERVLPRMALDFTTASLDSRVTFTRSGDTATVVNSSGNVASVAANIPRFNFNPTTLVCQGLLIEEARTNNQIYSQDLTQAIWNKVRISVSGNVAISPNNTQDADKVVEDTSASTTHFLRLDGIVVTSGVSYTYSFYAKAAGRSYVDFQFGSDSGVFAGQQVRFNLINGTAAIVSGTPTFNITNAANGWYRCSATAVASSTASNGNFRLFLATESGTSYTGDGVSGVNIWGAQFETGAFSTSYIPTVAATVTRNADVATMTGTNFSDWYTATTGAAVVWAIPQTATGTRPLVQFDDTTANEIITLRGNVANPELYIVDGGAPQAQIDAGTIVSNTAYKVTGAWNTDSCAAAQNGAAAVTDNTATIPTPTQLRIGSDGTNYASALIQKILYYPQRIINAEVQAFSK